jgi:hypothetical protein
MPIPASSLTSKEGLASVPEAFAAEIQGWPAGIQSLFGDAEDFNYEIESKFSELEGGDAGKGTFWEDSSEELELQCLNSKFEIFKVYI